MSNEPKPAQEWTVEEVVGPITGKKREGILFIVAGDRRLGSMNHLEAKTVCDAHNAALASLRQEATAQQAAEQNTFWRDRDKWNELHTQLRDQLAAERAKPKTTEYARGGDDHVAASRLDAEQFREQLAAERNKFVLLKDEYEGVLKDFAKLEKQLAAERERTETYRRASASYQRSCQQLRDQLAAACKISQDSQKALWEAMQQLAAEREKWRIVTHDLAKELNSQLAAEREAVIECNRYVAQAKVKVDELRLQVAALVDALKDSTCLLMSLKGEIYEQAMAQVMDNHAALAKVEKK